MKRLTMIDILRAVAIINMAAYHTLWDLVYIHRVPLGWFRSEGATAWQLSIRWAFILLSGFCFSLSKRKHKRGWFVFGCSWVITAVTLIAMPRDAILFGVLTLLGTAMILTYFLEPILQQIPAPIGIAASGLLFCFFDRFPFPKALYANYFTAFLGFPPGWFSSSDYVPVFPWLFAFWMGYFLFEIMRKNDLLRYLSGLRCRPLEWIGRHSLAIYMVHQPLIYGFLYLLFEVIR
ncbi:MAG: DUF1624 domain-containing protein [Clostridia bacterium]|nr:DUF1624 domain-containing protein [Clostridia bacterium]